MEREFPRVILSPRKRHQRTKMDAEVEEEEEEGNRKTREEIIREDVQRTMKRAHAAVRAANWNRVSFDEGEGTLMEASTSMKEEVPIEKQKSIRVGMLGVPNAGKSELVNALVGAKVSAVSRKTNTTRMETIGTRRNWCFSTYPGLLDRNITEIKRTRVK